MFIRVLFVCSVCRYFLQISSQHNMCQNIDENVFHRRHYRMTFLTTVNVNLNEWRHSHFLTEVRIMKTPEAHKIINFFHHTLPKGVKKFQIQTRWRLSILPPSARRQRGDTDFWPSSSWPFFPLVVKKKLTLMTEFVFISLMTWKQRMNKKNLFLDEQKIVSVVDDESHFYIPDDVVTAQWEWTDGMPCTFLRCSTISHLSTS